MERLLYPADLQTLTDLMKGVEDVYVVVDKNVNGYASDFCKAAGIHAKTEFFPLEASEESKSIATIERIAAWLLEHEADRDAFLIGIGGGITTDITGFAGSIYKRGIRYGLVPTTLLAQADASVGGKTGVNFGGMKNILGTFSEPEWVYLDPGALKTLSERDFMSGAAEVLKTFIIGDARMYRRTVEFLKAHLSRLTPMYDNEELEAIVRRCVEIKAGIVEQDRKEKGLRMVLNLGHTFGHAAEAIVLKAAPTPGTGAPTQTSAEEGRNDTLATPGAPPAPGTPTPFTLTHGEAVAAGIIATAELSVRYGFMDKAEADSLKEDLKILKYKTLVEISASLPSLSTEQFFRELSLFVRNDKKRKEDFINFVFIRLIGDVFPGRLNINNLNGLLDVLH